jgi:hypothetical protein
MSSSWWSRAGRNDTNTTSGCRNYERFRIWPEGYVRLSCLSLSVSLFTFSLPILHLQAHSILDPTTTKPFTPQFHLDHARSDTPTNPPLIDDNHFLGSLPSVLHLKTTSVQTYGKSLLLVLQEKRMGIIFLRVQFYLHGHMLVISERELLEIEQYQSRWPLSVRGNIHPHISLCIRSCNGGSSLVFLDHNKLLRYTIIQYPWSLERWLPDDCGPDPIRFWSKFKSGVLLHKTRSQAPVYLYMKK